MKPIRVLLVDDDDALRGTLARILTRARFEVDEASDGAAALRAWRRRPADVVVLDVVMPEADGIETMRELRRLAPDVPVIVMSGGGRVAATDYLDMARRLGAALTLAKPFGGSELIEAIDAVFPVD